MKFLVATMAALVLAAYGAAAAERGATGPIRVDARPVILDPARPQAIRQGNFTYAGGLQLTSVDTGRLGGLSDLRVSDAGELYAQSDEGDLLRARLRFDANGGLAGLENASITALTGQDGLVLPGKAEADSEGLALWPNGDLMVSFEHHHRIWIYPAAGGPPYPAPMPDAPMPPNQGMEGLALAPSRGQGAYWVGIEGGSIWLCRLSGACARDKAQIRPPWGFRLTALSEAPAGDLVVVHHFWNPLTKASTVYVSITRSQPGHQARLLDRLILSAPLTVDNFEGVEAKSRPDGSVRLYLVSDDNFSVDQRTLLLAFDWRPPPELIDEPPRLH